ncbi:hypothetical protein [Novosphingobium mangrovi (ex Huang et al. 2023)]|uniref:Uncharacterized protein n=1 Tax=Novosphingobium mangrovi (ex Huang et al. 2023) TaxID=2976432 RepID=A0ABT2I9V3_9SPHN|nr:hypothetical protein [Novosphingobium mangrovi (ex Huang et al. 2023)]MCT2401612.1 hypothetical protein [Novosphingobium mangrovi (ex Huang et al. 2023)]
MGLIRLAAVGAAGFALYKYITRSGEDRLAYGGGAGHFTKVRDAGPENMASAPASWSKTDEASDESFPASDPPGTY